MSVTVRRGVSYPLGSAWIEFTFLPDYGPDAGWISSVNVGSSKTYGVSWTNFDVEALFFTWGEAGVFASTDNPDDCESPTRQTDDDVLDFTKIYLWY